MYSGTCLLWTPLGYTKSVHYTQVSTTQRVRLVDIIMISTITEWELLDGNCMTTHSSIYSFFICIKILCKIHKQVNLSSSHLRTPLSKQKPQTHTCNYPLLIPHLPHHTLHVLLITKRTIKSITHIIQSYQTLKQQTQTLPPCRLLHQFWHLSKTPLIPIAQASSLLLQCG